MQINGKEVQFVGLGRPNECLQIMHEFVYKAESKRCHPKPCAIGKFPKTGVVSPLHCTKKGLTHIHVNGGRGFNAAEPCS